MFNEPEYDYDREPSEIENVFSTLVKNEVDKKVSGFFDKMQTLEKQHTADIQEMIDLKSEMKELKKTVKQIEEFGAFKKQINEGNIETLFSFLNLKSLNLDFSGMNSESIPVWFKLVANYYPEREKVFALLDLFEIKYPEWARTFKMPFDYGVEELDLIFDNLRKMYVCNDCLFSGNLGFFYSCYSRHKSLTALFAKESYVEIPWNLFLQNKLLTTEKYFTRIIEALKSKSNNSDYFFKIQDYQKLEQKQAEQMFDLLPLNNLFDIHKHFIELNKDIIRVKPELANQYKTKMNDNQFSSFYYLNFPVNMQKDFIRSYTPRYMTKFELIKKMNISIEDKLEFLREINEMMLTEDNYK